LIFLNAAIVASRFIVGQQLLTLFEEAYNKRDENCEDLVNLLYIIHYYEDTGRDVAIERKKQRERILK
jgi:hypothetical protein